MPIIEIPGLGNIEFPEAMSHDEINDAIKNNIMPTIRATQPSATSVGVPEVAPTPSAVNPNALIPQSFEGVASEKPDTGIADAIKNYLVKPVAQTFGTYDEIAKHPYLTSAATGLINAKNAYHDYMITDLTQLIEAKKEQYGPNFENAPKDELKTIQQTQKDIQSHLNDKAQNIEDIKATQEKYSVKVPTLSKKLDELESTPAYQKANEFKKVQLLGKEIINNPSDIPEYISHVGLESLPTSLPMMVSAIAASFVGGPSAAMMAGGATSAFTEFGNEYVQLRQEGKSNEEATAQAATKSGVIGYFDALSFGSAGKALDKIMENAGKGIWQITKSTAKEVGKETGKQATYGGAGELIGSIASQQPVNPRSVLEEAIGEVAGAPLEAVSTYRGKVKETEQANAIKDLQDKLAEVSKTPEETKPAGEKEPPTKTPPTEPTVRTVTQDQLMGHATTRLAELDAKANGVPAKETVDENGNKITVPAVPAQPMTEQETAELKFLQDHMGNPERLAQGYGVSIGEAKPVGSHDTEAALGELEGKEMPVPPIFQQPAEPAQPEEPAKPETPPAEEAPEVPPEEQKPPTEEKKPVIKDSKGVEHDIPTVADAEKAGFEFFPINRDKPMYAKTDLEGVMRMINNLFGGTTYRSNMTSSSYKVTSNKNKVLPKTSNKNQVSVTFRPDTLSGRQIGDDEFLSDDTAHKAIESFTIHNPGRLKVRGDEAVSGTSYLDQFFTRGNNPDGSITYTLRRTKSSTEKANEKEELSKEYLEHINAPRGKLKHNYKRLRKAGLNSFQQIMDKHTKLGDALKEILTNLEQIVKDKILNAPDNTMPFAVNLKNEKQAEMYIDIIKHLMKIEPVMKTNLFMDPYIIGGRNHTVPGFYNRVTNNMVIFANGYIDTFIHEAIHAATVHYIKTHPNDAKVQKLEKILAASRKNDVKTKLGWGRYGNTDLMEFIAEAFSNPNFIEHLSKMDPIFDKETSPSLFDNVKSIVRGMMKALGVNVEKDRTAFDEVMDLSSELFTGKTLEGYIFDKGHPLDAETLNVQPMDEATANVEAETRGIFNYLGDPIDIRKWEIPEQGPIATRLSKWFQEFADEHVILTKVSNAIRSLNRTISDMSDMEKKQELKNSRISDQLLRFANEEVNPILKQMLEDGVSMDDIKQYLHARHAEAYNNRMNDLNHRVDAQGNIIPYGLKDRASGMTTENANNYLNGLSEEREKVLKNIADKWYAIRDKTQQILVDSGQETQETIDLWNEIFPDYIPLNREQEQQAVPTGLRTGVGIDTRGDFSKRAMGSEKAIINPIDALLYQRERAVARAENNEVGKSVYRLALENPNPDFWLPINPDAIRSREKLIQELEDMGYQNAEEIADNIMAEPKERYLRPVRPSDFVIDPTTGLPIPNGKEVVDARISRNARFGDNVLTLKINGRERYVFFNQKDPNAVTMVRTLKNLDAQTLDKFFAANRFMNHYLGQVYTVLNPIFGIVNGIRDYPFGMANLSTTPIRGKQAEVSKKIFPAMMGIMGVLRKERAGDGSANKKWQQIYKEATEAGFQTSNRYAILNTGEDQTYIEQTLKGFTDNNAKQMFRYIINMTYDFASMIENGVRLAAYQQMREEGYTPQQSASVAKNLTINFDKKGSRTAALRSLYLFFNASIRGTVRLAQTLNPRTNPTAPYIIGGGVLLGVMQAMMIAGAGFKDDDPPEYIREHNLVIPTGDGKYITLPMPYGLNILPNTGRILTEAAIDINKNGFKKAKIGKKSLAWANSFLSTFSPFGNQGLTLNALVPSAVEPFAGVFLTNKNSFGQTISKQDSYTRPTPGYMRTKESGTAAGKEFARWMNLLSGGTDYTKGVWSPTGDDIDFLASSFTGPVVGSVAKTAKYIKAKVEGEEVPAYQVPVAGRFMGEIESKPVITSRFYNNLNAMYEHELTLKNLKGDPEATRKYIQDHPDARAYKRAEHVESQINGLNAKKKNFQMRGAPQEALQRIDNQKIIIMNRFNDQLERIRSQ